MRDLDIWEVVQYMISAKLPPLFRALYCPSRILAVLHIIYMTLCPPLDKFIVGAPKVVEYPKFPPYSEVSFHISLETAYLLFNLSLYPNL